jgi:aspartyl-tRNA(Asn)/glutamyl-tRNA(Gln) amidotransferase subunit C
MKLTKKEIEHIANLARLDLTDEEFKKYGEQLSGVLSYIEQLQEVDTTDVEPTAQVTGLENVMREDRAEDWQENEKERALGESPEIEEGQIKVKRVL